MRWIALILLLAGCRFADIAAVLAPEASGPVYIVDGLPDIEGVTIGWQSDRATVTDHATLVARVVLEVDPGSRIVAVAVTDETGWRPADLVEAVQWLHNQAHGVVLIEPPLPHAEQEYIAAVRELARRMPVVVPAGNAGIDICSHDWEPQRSVAEVIVVGQKGAAWSNWGPCVDVYYRGQFLGRQGTSLAAAAYAAEVF